MTWLVKACWDNMGSVDEVMRSYVGLCIDDWRDVPESTRRTMRRCLPVGVIAENIHEAIESISTRYDDNDHSRLRFIPMPTNRNRTGCFFFLPILQIRPTGERVWSFELLLIRTNNRCIAFRFEPATRGRHGYSHVQLCRRLQRKNTEVRCLPDWIHVGYPAFPSPGQGSLAIFLSMATAVHGVGDGGFGSVLRDAFQNRVSRARIYVNELHSVLGI